jgi:ribosomal protein S18 acetylase RimI-like enzyme
VQDDGVPAFETFRPSSHGTPDPRYVVRPARTADVPGVVAVAASRGAQPADLADRVARWATDPDRLLLVALAPATTASAGSGQTANGAPALAPVGVPLDPAAGPAGTPTRVLDASPASSAAPGTPLVAAWAMLAPWQGHADAPDGWYVSALTVAPGHRRRGLAARMLDALLDHARSHPRPWGGTVRSVVNLTNRSSIALHERHGFREEARGPSFAGITFTGGTGVLLRSGAERDGRDGPDAGPRPAHHRLPEEHPRATLDDQHPLHEQHPHPDEKDHP